MRTAFGEVRTFGEKRSPKRVLARFRRHAMRRRVRSFALERLNTLKFGTFAASFGDASEVGDGGGRGNRTPATLSGRRISNPLHYRSAIPPSGAGAPAGPAVTCAGATGSRMGGFGLSMRGLVRAPRPETRRPPSAFPPRSRLSGNRGNPQKEKAAWMPPLPHSRRLRALISPGDQPWRRCQIQLR